MVTITLGPLSCLATPREPRVQKDLFLLDGFDPILQLHVTFRIWRLLVGDGPPTQEDIWPGFVANLELIFLKACEVVAKGCWYWDIGRLTQEEIAKVGKGNITNLPAADIVRLLEAYTYARPVRRDRIGCAVLWRGIDLSRLHMLVDNFRARLLCKAGGESKPTLNFGRGLMQQQKCVPSWLDACQCTAQSTDGESSGYTEVIRCHEGAAGQMQSRFFKENHRLYAAARSGALKKKARTSVGVSTARRGVNPLRMELKYPWMGPGWPSPRHTWSAAPAPTMTTTIRSTGSDAVDRRRVWESEAVGGRKG